MWTIALNLLNNKKALIVVAALLVSVASFISGWKVAAWKNDSLRVEAIERAISEYEERDSLRNEIDNHTIESLRNQLKGYTSGKQKVIKYVKENPDISNRE